MSHDCQKSSDAGRKVLRLFSSTKVGVLHIPTPQLDSLFATASYITDAFFFVTDLDSNQSVMTSDTSYLGV